MLSPAGLTIRNDRTALVVYAIVMLTGLATFLSIGRQEYPDFTIRTALVVTPYPGRSTVQVEAEVTAPLEQSIRQMVEVKKIKSTSKPGLSILAVDLEDRYFELDTIWHEMRNRIATTALPPGAAPPIVNDDYGDVFPYIYALRGDGYSPAELVDYADDIRDALLALDGVAKVEFHGDQPERIYLEFSSSELAARGVAPLDAGAALRAQNAVTSSGSMRAGHERVTLITSGEFTSLEDLADYILPSGSDGSAVRVEDVFDIVRGYRDPPRSLAHFNGERVLCLAVAMTKGGVVTEIGERIEKRLADLQAALPVGLQIERMFFQPEYVAASVESFLVNLLQAFGFVVLVMVLFGGWRMALVVGVLVPSAVLACFAAMPIAGVQLEMMSIAALIIALGLLVDNAVVVSEQILVRLDAGEDRMTAVTNAAAGLVIPLLAASGTTIAAFSPIAMAEGKTSEFTYSLFAVVSLTLLASWLLSLTIVPLFCYYLLRPLENETFVGRLVARSYDPYERILRRALAARWRWPVGIVCLTLAAGWAFQFVPNIFFPPNERGQFIVDVELPMGVDISETESRVAELEGWLLDEQAEKVRSISAWIGDGGPRWYLSLAPEAANPSYAFLSVLTHSADPARIVELAHDVQVFARTRFPEARVTAKALENGPPIGDPIQVRLYGPDMTQLYALRDRIVEEMKAVDGLADIRDDWGAWVKQVRIEPDQVRVSRLGLNTESIATALGTQTSGLEVTTFREEDKAIPILLRSRGDYREHLERLPDLSIFGSAAGPVPLGQIAETSVETLPGSIRREDTLRVMTVKSRVEGRFPSEALAQLQPRLAELVGGADWPAGYRIEYGGEQEESGEAQGSIAAAMPIAISMLSLILISQFNSLRRFFIIMLTVPPMLIGVVPGLLLTGSSFGFMTLLGLIALLGIVVNNAILLIDETDAQLRGGLPVVEALVVSARSRLRPILMTTMTTVVGLVPLALGGGGMWSSMAFAMMFGLLFSTALTLILCPVLFSLFFRNLAPAVRTG